MRKSRRLPSFVRERLEQYATASATRGKKFGRWREKSRSTKSNRSPAGRRLPFAHGEKGRVNRFFSRRARKMQRVIFGNINFISYAETGHTGYFSCSPEVITLLFCTITLPHYVCFLGHRRGERDAPNGTCSGRPAENGRARARAGTEESCKTIKRRNWFFVVVLSFLGASSKY